MLRHWVIGHRLAVILTGAFWARIWRDGEAICLPNYRSIPSEGRESRLRDGWLCSEIGVVSHMSCEVELLYDHSGVKLTF